MNPSPKSKVFIQNSL